MAVEYITTKKCTRCGEKKPTTEFNKDATKRYGVQGQCKTCNKAYRTEYYAANKDALREYKADRYASNPSKFKARNAIWAKENKERFLALKAKWNKANPESLRTYRHNYRSRKRESGCKISPGLSEKLFKLQRGKCACCGKPLGDDYHLDHIMPISLGGSNTDDNIQLLRSTCNLQKSAKHPVDFMQQRGFLI